MSDERWRAISLLYDEAAALAPVDRAPFLRKACGGDEALRAEIESLLRDDTRVNELLEPKGSHTALIGQRIGGYEIRSLLGVGGMGEVYRARDSKLDRDVAIKVLPVGFAADGERLARFQREARLLASLNHPHIGGIHGLEDASGVPALVLELVEGDTLAERLQKGPIPGSEALHIARQIAEALETAHEHGIIHRDLKPANIKITPEGNVKVLDFGLAKAVQRVESHLQTSGLSHEGLVVGTPAYMGPEQARGKPVDRRADVWAFGCVLYEMLTGRVAFAAATVTDTLAAVLDRDPDWSALPDKTPPAIRRLLRRCLEKDPKLRLRDIGDAALDIREALTSDGVTSAEVRTDKTSHRNLARGVGAGLTLGAIAAALVTWNLSGAPGRQQLGEVRFVIESPPMPTPHSMAISPDGRTIVLAGANRSTDPNALPMTLPDARLFVRRLGSLQMYPLAGTEGAYHPFWSPDNRYVAFGTGGKLKVVDVSGGEPWVLCDLPGSVIEGGTWNSDNVVVFSTGGVLYRVSSAGGTPAVLARPNRSAGQQNFRWPQFLPDGRRYLYRVGSLQPTKRAVLIGTLDSDQTTTVLTGESNAAFVSPDLLLFTRRGALLTQRFELSTLQLLGEPTVLTEDVLQEANGSAAFAVSVSGVLAYRIGRSRSLVWIDRRGKASEPFGDLSADTAIKLSPDNKRIAFHEPRGDAADDIYIHDIDRNVTTQLTSNPGTDHYAVWSPDGSSLVFDRHSDIDNVDQGIYQKRADGATPERRILAPEAGAHTGVRAFTRDFLVIEKYKPGQIRREIWVQPSLSHLTPGKYLPSVNEPVALSPNSRWVAYISDEARQNVFVQSFPDPSQGRYQISSKGGSSPLWRRDGRELYYIDGGRRLIAVSVRTDGAFAIEGATELFSAPAVFYDVTADGQRFLFNVPSSAVATPAPITVVLNRANE